MNCLDHSGHDVLREGFESEEAAAKIEQSVTIDLADFL
jgi:hypothetical protein